MRANVWKELENYFLILLGTALMAIAIQWIFDRVGLITGGFTGLTIIIRNLTEALLPGGIPLWLTNIVLNIPIFLYLLPFLHTCLSVEHGSSFHLNLPEYESAYSLSTVLYHNRTYQESAHL